MSRFFPLDHELGLRAYGRLTLRAESALVRLGTQAPFAKAVELLGELLDLTPSERTVRRHTYAAGEAALAVEAAEQARIEQELPTSPACPDRLLLSLDATTVPLLKGVWGECKLAVFGEVVSVVDRQGQPRLDDHGHPLVKTINLTYVARRVEAADFAPLLIPEGHRRGLDRANLVLSPNDGAEWIQGGLDEVREDAVRILDSPHGTEHLTTLGGLLFGVGTGQATNWAAAQRTRLHTEVTPAGFLADLVTVAAGGPASQTPTGADGDSPTEALRREVAYFTKRADQIRYHAFRTAGYPIGSGCVESGHKLVIGSRFKGAGQHWAAEHLNPLVQLRVIEANGRWTSSWPLIDAQRRQTTLARMGATRAQRQAASPEASCLAPAVAPLPGSLHTPLTLTRPPATPSLPAVLVPTSPSRSPQLQTTARSRPAPNHPWRRPCLPSHVRQAG